MKRRDFIKYVGAAVVLGSIPKTYAVTEKKTLAIAEGADYEKIAVDAVNALGGMKKFVKKNDVVVIKPNIGWDRTIEQAANTHPLVIRALANECIKAGAKKVKIFDRTCNDPRRCYENSGMNSVIKNMKNVELKQIEFERFKKVELNGVFLKEWELYDEALSADVLINVPIAKNHALTKLTLALKNMMGIMGGNRGYIHRNIESSIVDVNKAVKSHLIVIDATRILLDHGPQGGDLKDVKVLNKVIATTDIVAADAYATTLFGLKPSDIDVTVTAHKRGLGDMNLANIRIVKV